MDIDDVGGWVILGMTIQSFNYLGGRCIFGLNFCWAAREPHFRGLLKVSLNLVGSEPLTSEDNVMLGWPRLGVCCLERNRKQLKEETDDLILRADTLKWKEGLRFEQGKKNLWDVKCSMNRARAAGTQYTVYSNNSARVERLRERGNITALQTMNRTSEEDDFVDQSTQVTMLRNLEAALGSPFDSGPQAPSPKPLVIVISGPSGVGKDAVIKRLQEVRKGVHFVVTATTRAKRPGEVDGKDYYFVSKQEFLSMIEKNELLEYALVYGDYKGIPKQQIRDFMSKGFDVVLRVDVQGVATLRSILGNGAVFIFLVAESELALVRRLMGRKTETMDKLLVRISTAKEEVKCMSEFDYVAVNAEGELERTVNLICSIIDAEKARVQQRLINI